MSDDALMQDMVMGEFDGTNNVGGSGGDDTATPMQATDAQSTAPTTVAAPVAATNSTSADTPQTTAQAAPQQDQPSVAQGVNAAESGMAIGGEAGENMFTDTFGDLTNLEDGDGLIDFGGGMDDAFGDALHGMDG
jgi:hypothetical protein